MRKFKKTLSVMLAAIMSFSAFSALTVTANAAVIDENSSVGEEFGDYEYQVLDDGTASITKYSGNETALVIPSEINGYKVTRIGEYAFCWCESLTCVTIPDSVTSIGWGAFENCENIKQVYIDSIEAWCNIDFDYIANPLENGADLYLNGELVDELTVPDSITSIGNNAFIGCTSLTNIRIPDSVTRIGINAFRYCTSLTNITIPDSVTIGNSAFGGCSSLTSVTIPGSVTSIDNYAFEDCVNIKQVYINNIEAWCNIDFNYGANPLGNGADLYLNGELVNELTIPDGVTSIGDRAFIGCASLTSVTIPDSVTNIGSYTFYNCTNLSSIAIPNSVTNIDESAFSSCTSLTNITIPDSVTSIGSRAFSSCTSLTSITIPVSVTSIGNGTFENCTSLTSITIPDSVTSISYGAFMGCKSLISVTIPDSITNIDGLSFYGCSSLTNIIIPDNVTNIGEWAFENCTSLTSITIPDSVTSVGYEAFLNCSSLNSITIPNSVEEIDEYAFGYERYYDQIKYDYIYEKVYNFVISGFKNSAAEQYANDNGFAFVEIGKAVIGDVNGDGVLSVADATLIQKHSASIIKFTNEQLALADFNGDGTVNVNDATAIQRALVSG